MGAHNFKPQPGVAARDGFCRKRLAHNFANNFAHNFGHAAHDRAYGKKWARITLGRSTGGAAHVWF